MAENQSLKVKPITKERIRLIASVDGTTQEQVVNEAVEMFVVNHRDELSQELLAARQTLLLT
jgi:predicted DNA-binding protein